MLQSEYFIKTEKQPPKNEVFRNSQLLVQAGFIDRLTSGVYTLLPIGLRVINNIAQQIRREMNKIGGQELFMPALHPIENYTTTKRDTIDVLFHLTEQSGKKLVLGQSHEEIIVPLAKKYIQSYHDLPFALYQIQTKFRNELRAKSGILRGREFLMKDLYSFHTTTADLEKYYKTVAESYHSIFNVLGIGDKTVYTFADGGTFSKYSHEFQTITDAGEDTIHLCPKCAIAVNNEIISAQSECPKCHNRQLKKVKSIEVGNIFPLKTKFSDAFELRYTDEKGNPKPVYMGCYGIGLGRVMGTIAELHNDTKGLQWPASVSPFHVHLLNLSKNTDTAKAYYKELQRHGIDVLFDDRNVSAGVKFNDADLIGITIRAIISDSKKDTIEIKLRHEANSNQYQPSDSIKFIKSLYREYIQ